MINAKELLEAKVNLRNILVKEHGEDIYQTHIMERVHWLLDFKTAGDKLLNVNDRIFRDEIRSAIVEKYKDTENLLYELVITDIALDTFLE